MYNACALCGKNGGNNVYHFFVPLEQIWDGHAQITGDDVNHIANVLRMKEGEKLVISAGIIFVPSNPFSRRASSL